MSVSITTINGSDVMKTSRATINTNFGNLKTAVEASQTDITALDGRLDTAESDIDTLQAADISLDSRIDTLEAAAGGGAIGSLWTLTPPVSTAFTWVNQGSATAANNTSSLILTAPAAASTNLRALVKSAPSTPYTLTALCYFGGDPSTAVAQSGILLREASSGKAISLHFLNVSGLKLEINKWNSATSWNSSVSSTSTNESFRDRCYFQIANSGSVATFRYSFNGLYWVDITTSNLSGFVTAYDQIGLFCNSENSKITYGAFPHFSTSALVAA